MASAREEGELCVATMDDRQSVRDTFGDVYFGADYLYSGFPYIVQGPGAKAFIYKVKDEVVAFAGTLLVDDGQTLVTIAARVKEVYRGQGAFSRFHQMIHDHFSDRILYPKLCREMQTTTDTNLRANGDKMRKSGWREIGQKPITKVTFTISRLSDLTMPEVPHHQVTALKEGELQKLFSSDPSQWLHLFPEKRVVVGWEPYLVMAENVHSLLNGRLKTVFYGTKASLTAPRPQSPDAKLSILTAGSYYRCALGISYFVDVCGAADNSEEVGDHLNAHLQRLKDVVAKGLSGKVIFHVVAQETLHEILLNVTRQLQPFLVKDIKHVKMLLLERDW